MTNNTQDPATEAFEREKENLTRHNKVVEDVVAANKYLKQFNWAYVHPYVMGGHVKYFLTLEKEGRGSTKTVFQIFARLFYDLRTTTHFIDSIFKTRPELEPFCHLIDQSVVMCLQRDYAGAINTLLPVIEGSLRHYLVNRQGMNNNDIKKPELLSVFTYLKVSHLAGQRHFYEKHYKNYYGPPVTFSADQLDELVGLKEACIDMWFDIIKHYLDKSLYISTKSPDFFDGLNRHVIFHGLTSDIYYNLENYLRIFNCIIFLSWAFAMGHGGSFLFGLEDEDILDKWIAFEQIRVVSWTMTPIKSKAFTGHPDFNPKDYEEDIVDDELGKGFKKMNALPLDQRLQLVDQLIRKGVANAKAANASKS
jgi:hypothetical protein